MSEQSEPVPTEGSSQDPTLLLRGQFALYSTPDGGAHLSYRPDGADEDQHMAAPAAMIRAFEAMATGAGPLAAVRGMLRIGRTR